jgi:hypothetical protein
MNRLSRSVSADTAWVLRTGLLVLAGIAIGATAVELATERHWASPVQLVPWFALAVLALALALLAMRPRRPSLAVARSLAVLVLVASVYGVVEHVAANLDAGVLDATYSSTWDSLPFATRLWYAVTKTVGPSPPLAPGVLAQSALLMLLATWRHPASTPSTKVDQSAGTSNDG